MWHADALCREHPHVDFFPKADADAARAVCSRCPVTSECLAAAQAGREWGVWAGTSPMQRTKLRATAA